MRGLQTYIQIIQIIISIALIVVILAQAKGTGGLGGIFGGGGGQGVYRTRRGGERTLGLVTVYRTLSLLSGMECGKAAWLAGRVFPGGVVP